MPTPAEQPRFDQPVVDQSGRVTQPWANYFLRMASAQSSDDLRTLYEALAARVAELEDGQDLSFQILGQRSISVNGVVQPGGVVIITLQGDTAAPGNTQYYGTGPTGEKGWFPVSDAITVAAGELTKAVGANGVTTLGLADLANSGVGAALVKITRDAKGRVSGTQAATTDDLPAGSTNKYFPEAPNDGWPYVRQSLSWAPLDGPNSPYALLRWSQLTDQLGNPLTDQQGRPLLANSAQIPYQWLSGVPANLTGVAGLTGQGYAFRSSGGAWSLQNIGDIHTLVPMTLAQANALTPVSLGRMVIITDLATGNPEPCWYDATVASGTKWRRFSDRSIAS